MGLTFIRWAKFNCWKNETLSGSPKPMIKTTISHECKDVFQGYTRVYISTDSILRSDLRMFYAWGWAWNDTESVSLVVTYTPPRCCNSLFNHSLLLEFIQWIHCRFLCYIVCCRSETRRGTVVRNSVLPFSLSVSSLYIEIDCCVE